MISHTHPGCFPSPYPFYILGMLRLGGTGKAIRPSHENSGIASVASITLARLVTPLKVLNIDDKELELLKEIVLFNSGKREGSEKVCRGERERELRQASVSVK